MSPKKKILIFTSTFPRWQNDTDPPFVFELARRLTTRFEVHVLAPAYPGAKDAELMEDIHVRRFHYFIPFWEKLAGGIGMLPTLKSTPLYYFQVPFFLAGACLALRRMIRQIHPDILHAHWVIPQGLVAALHRDLFGAVSKLVVTAHGGDIFGLKRLGFLKRFVLNRADCITVVSNAVQQEVLKFNLSASPSLDVIPMGVDSSRFSPDKKNSALRKKYDIRGPFLLFVGRLTEKKGVRYLIDAMPYVLSKYPDARLLIVGSGELEGELKQRSMHLGSSICFTGAVPNEALAEYYATADLFIMPSVVAGDGDREGFGLVCVEAAMSGCTVVAFDIPAVKDILGQDYTYYANSETLGAVIVNAIQHPEKVDVSRFDWSVICEKYTQLYLS